jgi:uncharacterized protein (TIGR03000 family)
MSKPLLRIAVLAGAAILCLMPFMATSQPPVPEGKVRLTVKLPADAKLTVDGAETKSTGPERLFESPPLTPNKKFSYTLEAVWTDNNAKKTAKRKVVVEAGKRYVVDFLKPEPVEKKDDKKGKDEDKKGKDDDKKAKDDDKKGKADDKKKDVEKKTDKKDDDKKKDTDKKKNDDNGAAAPRTREFDFTYAATVKDLKRGQTVRIWLPVPPSGVDQQVRIVNEKLPGKAERNKEPRFGNEILHVEGKAGDDGTLPLSVTYRVTRKEVLGKEHGAAVAAGQADLFLKEDRHVPVGGKPAEKLLKDTKLPGDRMALGKALFDIVNRHMVYSKKGTGWGNGDAVWACDSGYGNCTDFHSLFISLARTENLPAKFEIGFGLPPQRGKGDVKGYHCWAEFTPDGKRWIPVDISQANQAKDTDAKLVEYLFGNLTEDRVTFSVGRDIGLVPPQAGAPLNFFIYPHVEVEGKAYPADKVQKTFTYQDVN